MNSRKQKKTDMFLKKLHASNLKKKHMPLEFREQFLIGVFLKKKYSYLRQLKQDSFFRKIKLKLNSTFQSRSRSPLKKKLNSTFKSRSRSRFFAPFPRSLLNSAIYLSFSRLISIELKKCIYTQVHS